MSVQIGKGYYGWFVSHPYQEIMSVKWFNSMTEAWQAYERGEA